MNTRHRIVFLALAAVLVAAGGYRALQAPQSAAVAQSAPQPPSVDVAVVDSRRINDWQHYSGRLEAIDRVEVRPLVSGTITEVHFADGSLVKAGDPLFTIDPRPYAAAVDRAEAALAGAKARASYTAADLARARRLIADNAIARRDLEEKENAAREAAANVQAAEAALQSARLDLAHTRIVAPVAGRVSRAEVTVGNVVSAGAGARALTTLVSVDRVYAAFDVDEQSFLKSVNPARAAGQKVTVHLGLANEQGYSREGVVHSVDNQLDTSSGTIRVRAVFDNADGTLVPGLYARVRLDGTPRDAVLIDERAVGTDQARRFVLVLDEEGRANYREVVLGANQNGMRVVERGLAAGERIVVNGLQRVRPGDPVRANEVAMGAPVRTAAASLN